MVDIDTKNSQSVLIIAADILIKVYYLKNTREFFLYYLNQIGIVPIKHTNINHVSKIIMDNLPQNDDIEVKIRYSCYTSKKKKNKIQHLSNCPDGVGISYNNILTCLKLIS